MWRARKSARHLEDQVTPILCVLLSAWEQRFRKLESSWGGAAHSPHKHPQNVYIQHPPPSPPPPSFSSSSPPPFTLLISVLCACCSSSLAPALCRALLCALCSFFTRLERKKKREREQREREKAPPLSPSFSPSLPPSFPSSPLQVQPYHFCLHVFIVVLCQVKTYIWVIS